MKRTATEAFDSRSRIVAKKRELSRACQAVRDSMELRALISSRYTFAEDRAAMLKTLKSVIAYIESVKIEHATEFERRAQLAVSMDAVKNLRNVKDEFEAIDKFLECAYPFVSQVESDVRCVK